MRRVFHEWFSLLAGQGAGGAAIEGFEEMERLEEADELRTPVQDRARAWARAWQEAEREQGRAQGVEQGRAEGVERERALLRRLTERKFGAETADRLSAFLAGIGEPERLADIGDWIIDCASGDELGELRTPVQDRVRAWREAERAQGRAEGVEQGRAEGVDQERALLRRLAERKFGAETADRLSAFLARIGGAGAAGGHRRMDHRLRLRRRVDRAGGERGLARLACPRREAAIPTIRWRCPSRAAMRTRHRPSMRAPRPARRTMRRMAGSAMALSAIETDVAGGGRAAVSGPRRTGALAGPRT